MCIVYNSNKNRLKLKTTLYRLVWETPSQL